MAQSHRESRDFPLAEAQRLKAEGLSNYAIAQTLGWSEPTVRRKLQGRRIKGEPGAPDDPPATNAPTNGDISTDTALVSADGSAGLVGIHDDTLAPAVQSHALDGAEILADHETRLQVLESFVATLQVQLGQPAPQTITVQSSAGSVYALNSADTVQPWDDPEDGKPERWNLWIPRGLKRQIEALAKTAGIAPSQLVQRLLMAALPGKEVRDA